MIFNATENRQTNIYFDGRYIGEFQLLKREEENSLHFGCFSIFHQYQNRGFGKQFMLSLIKQLKENGYSSLYLNCLINNDYANRLYISVGFTVEKNNEFNYLYKINL